MTYLVLLLYIAMKTHHNLSMTDFN